jgi:hypothetical protein
MRKYRLDALFLIQVCLRSKFCPSVLEIVCLRVPAWYIRDFTLLNVAPHANVVPLLEVQVTTKECRSQTALI